ncbi:MULTISPECIES: hypothetical protein [Weeksella]|uniref:hypothetical protein n=1 Tax=Weeksella TaxID=1013 RepID=UPI000DFB6A7B|nr:MULTISPECIES: hypothetical protein [Weeksella]MDK7375057.1 hypothetical protein [Weeksella virosa]MDK7675904.1 hypothetical protein [Weeksella virosa]SUP53517.1 Uncharacterised protein [Weeksella virosa]
MKQTLFLAAIFFVIFLGLKMVFDHNNFTTQLLHSAIATSVFIVFRLVFRNKKTKA